MDITRGIQQNTTSSHGTHFGHIQEICILLFTALLLLYKSLDFLGKQEFN